MAERAIDFISIVMPALNEARHIEAAIASIEPAGAAFDYEILVLDGGSTDETAAIVTRLAAANPRIRLIANPERTQAAATNAAARLANARSSLLLRADCHAHYPPDFAQICLAAFSAHACASVVVPMLTVGRSCMQTAIAAAQNSRLGNGGSSHRIAGSSGYVDHGHHALFDRALFLSVGGYDETMPSNEDAELDRRLTEAGHRIWLCGDATIEYFPRSDLQSLARQYFAYGAGRASTILRHRMRPKLRQLFPLFAFTGCLLSLALSVVDVRFAGLAASYLLLCLGWGAVLALREREPCALLAGPAAITMHMAWAIGFLTRLMRTKAQVPQGAAGPSGICNS
ncbi:MAG: glycosyltransferase family 2 protein [Hyphomicrobiales bacterium]|nr:glycosyltransferase family 2 protein [Hyphomicrobiales bacterium]